MSHQPATDRSTDTAHFGFVLAFLIASATGIAGGAPFTAAQVLFVNLVMDGRPRYPSVSTRSARTR